MYNVSQAGVSYLYQAYKMYHVRQFQSNDCYLSSGVELCFVEEVPGWVCDVPFLVDMGIKWYIIVSTVNCHVLVVAKM